MDKKKKNTNVPAKNRKEIKNINDEISVTKNKNGIVQIAIDMETRQKASGFKTDANDYILNTTLSTNGQGLSSKEVEEKIKHILLLLSELEPHDGFEGILTSQMLTAYDQAMKCFKIADGNINSSKLYERYLNQGVKLMRLYNQQLETLDKHRRKGNQKMTVEHVNVHAGGQAIVGEVHQGGGASNEK